MATLYIFAQQDLELNITTIADLKAALPTVPDVPSIYRLGFADNTVQIIYGSPDRQHTEVKFFTGGDIKRESFERVDDATDRFLALCQTVLS